MKYAVQATIFSLLIVSFSAVAFADAPPDYYPQKNERYAPASPIAPWEEDRFYEDQQEVKKDHFWGEEVIMWFPRRFLDLFDMFKVDVGVGPSYGGVVKLTKFGQFGYRRVNPWSARLGVMGRKAPAMIEHNDEYGLGGDFKQSKERLVCNGEFGLGLDIFIAGGYVGVCPDEMVDFVAGIFTFDPSKDDDF